MAAQASDETIHFGWFIPTFGDGQGYGDKDGRIPAGMDLFVDVAQAAEDAGFEFALVPVEVNCWEAWISCSMIAARTERLRLLVAARPGYIVPTLMAKMVTTFDQLGGGRVYINLIAGPGGAQHWSGSNPPYGVPLTVWTDPEAPVSELVIAIRRTGGAEEVQRLEIESTGLQRLYWGLTETPPEVAGGRGGRGGGGRGGRGRGGRGGVRIEAGTFEAAIVRGAPGAGVALTPWRSFQVRPLPASGG